MNAPRARVLRAETERLGSRVIALRRLTLYLTVTLLLIPLQIAALLASRRLARLIPLRYHRLCCRIFGIRVETIGVPSPARPTMFVSNHASYLDIIVLGGLIETSFIAKAEIARWPFFGWLAMLQRTEFIDRRGFKAAAQRDAIHRRLVAGDDLVLFPEGTSNDGISVQPFKSALFAVAQDTVRDRPLTVQPVSIAYVKLDGLPIGRALRPYYTWYGGMTLVPHLWEMLGLGTVTVSVTFHPLVEGPSFPSRKALAEHCFRLVSQGVQAANRGRQPAGPEMPPAVEPSPPPVADRPAVAGAQP